MEDFGSFLRGKLCKLIIFIDSWLYDNLQLYDIVLPMSLFNLIKILKMKFFNFLLDLLQVLNFLSVPHQFEKTDQKLKTKFGHGKLSSFCFLILEL